jgi:antirestriction protein
MANITFYSLSDYNNGDLISKTFDLEDFPTYDDLATARSEWLEERTEELDDGVLREEFIVADYEGIPASLMGQWDIDSDYGDWLEACVEYGAEVVNAATELDIPFDKIEEAYAGIASSDVEFAEELADSIGLLDEVPDNLKMYFDMAAFARDLMINDYHEHNGHYFHNNW